MPTGVRHRIVPGMAALRTDRRIDMRYEVPLASSPMWVGVRTFAHLAAALVILLARTENHERTFVVLVLGAALQPLLLMAFRRHDASLALAATDVVVASAVIALMPSLYPAATLWMGTLVSWQAITNTVRGTVPIAVLAMLAPNIAAGSAGVERWWMVGIAQLLLTVSFLIFGRALRIEVAETENDLMATVQIGRAFIHRSTIRGGTAAVVYGDVEGLTGYDAEEWIGLDHRSIVHPDDIDHFWLDLDAAIIDRQLDRIGRYRHKDGRWIWIRDVSRVTRDQRGNLVLRGFTIDVTESQERQIATRRQARLDALTGLPNRLSLDEELVRRLDSDEDFALLLFDINRFKEVNDTLGHESGDRVLITIGQRLQRIVGQHDHLARMGGDEFAIIAAGMDDGSAVRELASAVSEVCREPILVRGMNVGLSASIGIVIPGPDRDRASTLRHADIAMYTAKRAGIPYRVFDTSLEQSSTMQLALSAALPTALTDGQIELYFQPQYDIATCRLVAAEGLVRWRHPEFGLLTPDAFLDVALVSARSAEFLAVTLRQAIEMAGRARDSGYPVRIAVNVSIPSIRDLGFSERIFELLNEHRVPADLLTLEVTEAEAEQLADDIAGTLNALGRAGVKISLDDFGTGYSSLERLRGLDLDELKIDRAFVNALTEDQRDRDIVQTIVDLGQRLRVGLVAEGVETAEQARLLAEMGCDTAQGYLYARPMSAGAFLELLAAEAAKPAIEH